MKENFKKVEELLGNKLIQIDSQNALTTISVKSAGSLSSFIETLNPSIVLCVKKTVTEKLNEFAPKVVEAKLGFGSYLNFLQQKATNEAHLHFSGSVEQERYFEFADIVGKLINIERDKEICYYQLFFPINGIFLTADPVSYDWLNYYDLFTDFQDIFIKTVQR